MMKTTIATLALIVSMSQPVRAALIEYSWEGRIVPEDVNQDPWNIGAAGKAYFVSASVDENAVDGGAAIDRAGFGPPDIVFLIDGASPTSLDHGHLTFSELATRDTISILFHDIGFTGIVEDRLFVTVGLPTSTFTFTNPIEAPPLFPPTLTVTAGGTGGDGSSYATFTDVGVLVTATRIPEPSTFVLALLGLVSFGNRAVLTQLGFVSSQRRS